MFLPAKSTVIVKYGEEQAPFISVQGDGFQRNTLKTASVKSPSLVEHTILDLGPVHSFPVTTECSCLRSAASNLSARKNGGTQFADKFCKYISHVDSDDPDEERQEGEEEDDESLHLNKLLSTFHKFSSRILNPLQARSIARLAKSYKGNDSITKQHAENMQGFLDCDSPPIQDAALITLSKLAAREDNIEALLSQCSESELLDIVLSLASDPPTIEVQISALSAIEQITVHENYIMRWEQQLEDIVYPLIHAIIKNQESAEVQKLSSLSVMKNLSQIPDFAAKVKQDILSQLSSSQDNSKIMGRYLEILQENLQLCKQKISSDILDNTLLPVLTDMLIQGPCQTQCQSLRLLTCLNDYDTSRSSLVSNPQTVALCILCVKHSKCRKVVAYSCHMIQDLLRTRTVIEARRFMECISESVQLVEGDTLKSGRLTDREDKVNSPVRRKSRAEAQLWRHFDDFIGHLILLLERQGCIYHENAHTVKCELSLIGSINGDQLACITSLIVSFNNLCSWPLRRPRKSGGSIGEVDEFLLADVLGIEIKHLSHHHAISIWARVGASVMALFRQVMKRVPVPDILNTPTTKSFDQSSDTEDEDSDAETPQQPPDANSDATKGSRPSDTPPVSLESILYPEEAKLLKELVKFILLMSIASCYFKKSSHVDGRHGGSQSVNENVEKRAKEEIGEREICSERRILRRSLVEEGVFYLMAQLVRLEDGDLKTMSATILRLCLQPVNEKAQVASAKKSAQNNFFGSQKVRPQSAKAAYDAYARDSINQTLFQMSKPGIGQRPQSSVPYCTARSNPAISSRINGTDGNRMGRSRPVSAKPSFSREATNLSSPGSAKYSMFSPLTTRAEKKPLFLRSGGEAVMSQKNDFRPSSRLSSLITQRSKSKTASGEITFKQSRPATASSRILKKEPCMDPATVAVLVAPLDPGNNLSQQCCERALLAAGETILKGIFSTDMKVKNSSLLLLHDLVLHSKSDVHMDLSKRKCIPKLVDFLRINDDNELLEITGLTITRMLVSSDRRICQLFNIHGGPNMLMALLHKHPTQTLKEAIGSTLNTVNFVMHTAPATPSSSAQSPRPPDIWEHIMHRWEGEDKVVAVLKQFL